MHADERAIRQLIVTWHRASQAGDLPTLIDLMDDDVVFLTAGQAPMRGKQTFAAAYRAGLERFQIESSSQIEEVRTEAGFGYCWSYLSVTITPLGGGTARKRSGHALSVFKRLPDERWVLSRDANLLVESAD